MRTSGKLRNSALIECNSAHKAAVLFELRPHKWRNAVDLHHLPAGTHSLAPRPGSLVRLTFQIGRRRETCTPKAVRS